MLVHSSAAEDQNPHLVRMADRRHIQVVTLIEVFEAYLCPFEACLVNIVVFWALLPPLFDTFDVLKCIEPFNLANCIVTAETAKDVDSPSDGAARRLNSWFVHLSSHFDPSIDRYAVVLGQSDYLNDFAVVSA